MRFRLRCKVRKCKISMELVPSQYWIAHLIEEGRLCRSLVGLPPDDDTVFNFQQPSSIIAIAEPAVTPSVPLLSHSPQPQSLPSHSPQSSSLLPHSLQPLSSNPHTSLARILRYPPMFSRPANGQCTWLDTTPPIARTNWTARDGHCPYRVFQMAYMGRATDDDVWQLRRKVADRMRQPDARAIPAVSYNHQCWMSESLNPMHGYVSDYDQYLKKVESDENM